FAAHGRFGGRRERDGGTGGGHAPPCLDSDRGRIGAGGVLRHENQLPGRHARERVSENGVAIAALGTSERLLDGAWRHEGGLGIRARGDAARARQPDRPALATKAEMAQEREPARLPEEECRAVGEGHRHRRKSTLTGMHRAAPTALLFALSCAGNGGGGGKCPDPETLYADQDGDGHGTADDEYEGCDAPQGYVLSNDDCDDADLHRSPDALEQCNAIDDDCDELVDDEDPSLLGATTAYADRDGDGFGTEPGILVCEVPDGFVDNADDCDDEAGATSPGALEVCGNAGDENCDELAEECRLGGDLSMKSADFAIVPQLYSAYEQLGAAMT